jgi:hypothetical protein
VVGSLAYPPGPFASARLPSSFVRLSGSVGPTETDLPGVRRHGGRILSVSLACGGGAGVPWSVHHLPGPYNGKARNHENPDYGLGVRGSTPLGRANFSGPPAVCVPRCARLPTKKCQIYHSVRISSIRARCGGRSVELEGIALALIQYGRRENGQPGASPDFAGGCLARP